MKILTKKKYNHMLHLIGIQHKRIMKLQEENSELKKKLLYQTTYNSTMKDIIFPNTDERGLSDRETPIDFPDLF